MGIERLAETTRPCGTDLALGIEARCRALLSDGAAAGELYREAIDRLSRTRLRPELARAHLLYGEWLRRGSRRTDARKQLHTAHDMLAVIGMQAFAERARRELIAGTRRAGHIPWVFTLAADPGRTLACDWVHIEAAAGAVVGAGGCCALLGGW